MGSITLDYRTVGVAPAGTPNADTIAIRGIRMDQLS